MGCHSKAPYVLLWPKLDCMMSGIIQYFFMCFHVLRKNGSWDVAVVLSRWQYLKIDLASAPNSVVPRAGRVIRVSRPHSHPPSTALALVARAPLLARLVTPTTICVLCERSKGEKRRTYNPFKKNCTRSFLKAQHWDGLMFFIDAHQQTVLEYWQGQLLYFI